MCVKVYKHHCQKAFLGPRDLVITLFRFRNIDFVVIQLLNVVAKSGYAVVVVRGGCMPRITIYIDRRTYGALEVIASQKGATVRDLIKEIIKKYVESIINQSRR
jgi:hypothetical protein